MATSLAPLAHIQQELRTQDNACTAHPLYVVFNKRRIYGMDPEFGDDHHYEWIDNFSGDFTQADERKKLACDRYERMYGQNPKKWDKRYYVEVDEFVTCFFTLEAAQLFIVKRRGGYNHLHVYVDSLYRNQEMQDIRNALLEGRFREVV